MPPPLAILQTLRDHGHTAYLAGGCVRDQLLGLEPKDYDVATDAPPDVVRRLFPRSQAVGEAFGVVLVTTGRGPDRVATEVATFRTEGAYSDGRRPDAVQFTDAEHDAQRRDFTVNGLFLDPFAEDDGVIDFVGGRADLDAKIIRAIGDPDRRFAEDYLRMLRAVRFTARLRFTLEDHTAAAIREHADRLNHISRERIGGELRMMLTGPRRAETAALLQSLRLDGPALNEDPRDGPLPTLGNLDDRAGFATALAAWMTDRGETESLDALVDRVPRWRKAVCLSNDETATLRQVLRQADAAQRWNEMPVARRKRWLADDDADATRQLLGAMGTGDAVERDAATLAADGTGIAPAPLLTGADLIAAGLAPGPRFKSLLDEAYDAQLEGRLADRDAALRWLRDRPKMP
ncbi:MAG: CCA tRNA nucleotidyltransferase [Planctomycetota bacterium]